MLENKIQMINLETKNTANAGSLTFFESKNDIPFEIKRIYYIYAVPAETVRGGHAHKKLEQLIICLHGKIKVILDDGNERKDIVLKKPNCGLYLSPGLWRDIVYLEEDSLLFVAASEYYDESDYIRDYDEFLAYAKGR